jgi:hypothetical protein
MKRTAKLVTDELARLGAGGDDGIEVEPAQGVLRLYDTQESVCYRAADVLRTLRALPDASGFEAAWQALTGLKEQRQP